MRRILSISLFLLLMGIPDSSEAQIGIRFGVGAGVGGTVHAGHRSDIPDSMATWLESDVDVPPRYPGGPEAIAEHFRTDGLCDAGPVDPDCRNKMEVLVWFIVERDGSVRDAWIDRGGCDELEARTVCAVLHMQRWDPGLRGDHPVRTRVRIPVHYTAQ
ncbi:MAG TPA: energy transducer TonB [Flavobacteriales bacterium]|nr:energy transducer TonB [Flavobacteriales bacterium]